MILEIFDHVKNCLIFNLHIQRKNNILKGDNKKMYMIYIMQPRCNDKMQTKLKKQIIKKLCCATRKDF